MNNYELLDMIGDVNEDYVQAADSNAVQPRFRRRAWAACAACAALVLGIGLSQRAGRTVRSWVGTDSEAVLEVNSAVEAPAPEPTLAETPALHPYTLVEGRLQIETTAGGAGTVPSVPPLAPCAPGAGAEDCLEPSETGLPAYNGQTEDISAQEEANRQCERLYQWLFGTTLVYPDQKYPEWFGGVWLDNDCFPEARLAIAIVDSLHTAGLEDQIRERCGGTGEIMFPSVKYSRNQLVGLMDKIAQTFDELNCRSYLSYGLDEMENRVQLDFSDTPSDEVLAALAGLDPDGDAIFIRVFIGARIVPTDGEPPQAKYDVICGAEE